ncbi:DNA repair protein RecO [Bacteroidia bacterium]|nr:DNA repair protein RecO [Bacteroidia bacterium]GHV03648.1 DNA repair protein RecO [Bacteroidia bacterium]
MLSKTRGIVLHSFPYNDTYSIIHLYTEAFGRVAYMVACSRGKKSSVSKALFMPLSILDMEVDHKNNRDLHRIRETKLCYPLSRIFTDPIKNVLSMFLSEILFRVVRETEPDPRLFDFLNRSILILEEADEGVANFHLVFLLHLLVYLGFTPNAESYKDGSYFDMLNGVFSERPPLHHHFLSIDESKFFARFLRITYENMSLYAFSRHDRVNILQQIITYYRLHLPEFPEIKSLGILQSLFD